MIRKITFILAIAILTIPAVSQKVLYDDRGDFHRTFGHRISGRHSWKHFIDSLTSRGIQLYYTSEVGWNILDQMDVLWLVVPDSNYDTDKKEKIVNFCRNGGRVILFDALAHMPYALNDLLLYPKWSPNVVYDTSNCARAIDDRQLGGCHTDFGNLDTINSIQYILSDTTYDYIFVNCILPLKCGNNAIPFAYYNDYPVAAISFPFLSEGNCSSFVFVFTGTDVLEDLWIDGEPRLEPLDGTYRFFCDLFCIAAGVPGFEFNPCDFVDSVQECYSFPNPITPNADNINDYVQFHFGEIFVKPARIHIFDIHGHEIRTIDVPAGLSAKQHARWDGADDGGNPVPEGVYIYTIEVAGEVVCEGTVTVAR